MTELPHWLPELLLFEDYGGCWQRYEDEVYSKFYTDFIASKPFYEGMQVEITKNLIKGKERSFWHCIQEGRVEEERTPDLKRCERIAWIRAIIEHSSEPTIKKWQNKKGRNTRQLLWFEEAEFLVVLEKRAKTWLLWTAYCTTWKHTKDRLRKEYEESLK